MQPLSAPDIYTERIGMASYSISLLPNAHKLNGKSFHRSEMPSAAAGRVVDPTGGSMVLLWMGNRGTILACLEVAEI